ncbi:MAG TPA: alpha/beta hydrolase [Caulobacteraceae bacterium]|jgi:pimeloyl-ACP methyl ester carboxylesterase|nr:alpha/beta hydrolase [Caulobacteraceae bacterium]
MSQTVSDELIEMRGLRFHFRDWAAQSTGSPSLVLLHGYTGHARSWDAFAEAMTDRYRVLALDQRGHGESGWASDYAIGEMTSDLEAFAAALGLSGFTLLGLSMGGMVAMDYAGRRPKELAALVIVDIAPEIVASGSARIQQGQKVSDVFASRDEAFAAARAANPVPPEAHHRHRVDYNVMRMQDGRWTWRYDRALRNPAALGRRDTDVGWRSCAEIAVPTLIIRGENSDILSPELAERMVMTIPDASLVTVSGSGHAVPLDAPDRFLAAAREFLKG